MTNLDEGKNTMPEEVPCANHPDYETEKRHLDKIIKIIEELLIILDETLSNTKQEWGYDYSLAIVELFLRNSREEERSFLESAVNSPYFARVDFRPDGHVRPESYYIGYTGVNEFRVGDNAGIPYVIDWRTPIAEGVYYQAKNGRGLVRAPEETYAGEILLRRQFEIEKRQLLNFMDDDTMERFLGDKFLIEKLLQGANQKLKDIVATIQREQDEIIRRPMAEVTLVQGVAGSGKTTVGLHRIAYLLYTYKLNPRRMAVIAPNKLFLHYISEFLPGLHADGVWNGTFQEVAEQITGIKAEVTKESMLDRIMQRHAVDDSDSQIRWIRYRGSLDFKVLLETSLVKLYAGVIDNLAGIREEITAESKTVTLTVDQTALQQRLSDPALPLNKAIRSLNEYMRVQLEDQLRRALDLYEVKAVRRRDGRRTSTQKELVPLPMPQVCQEILDRLLAKYTIPLLEARKVYASILVSAEIVARRERMGLSFHGNGPVEEEDLAALCYLQLRLEGVPDGLQFDHIMIDEVQDLTPFELVVISRLCKNESLTLLGDLNQAIYAYRSFASWEEAAACFTASRTKFFAMSMSYRSAAEVVEWCNRLIPEHLNKAKPVYRINEQPGMTEITSEGEAIQDMLTVISNWQAKGNRSIGIIVKTLEGSRRLFDSLRSARSGLAVNLIQNDTGAYQQGISIVPVHLAKGLEFDGVILADAGEENYQNTARDRIYLYVALSRALYRIHVFYSGQLSYHLVD